MAIVHRYALVSPFADLHADRGWIVVREVKPGEFMAITARLTLQQAEMVLTALAKSDDGDDRRLDDRLKDLT